MPVSTFSLEEHRCAMVLEGVGGCHFQTSFAKPPT